MNYENVEKSEKQINISKLQQEDNHNINKELKNDTLGKQKYATPCRTNVK